MKTMQKTIKKALSMQTFSAALYYIIDWEQKRIEATQGSKVSMLRTLVREVANNYKIEPSIPKI